MSKPDSFGGSSSELPNDDPMLPGAAGHALGSTRSTLATLGFRSVSGFRFHRVSIADSVEAEDAQPHATPH